MKIASLDWDALDRLRARFLSGDASAGGPYWQSESDLETYDATFGERIGWKWDAVLRELARLRWKPASRHILDWGCGSGVAGRRVIEAFGAENFDSLALSDHSPLAARFAAARARSRFPALRVTTGGEPGVEPELLVVSHVLNELPPEDRSTLIALAMSAQEILWVEPGTHAASRALIAVREELQTTFDIIAPCPHQSGCGILSAGNERHWCHFFAAPPAGIQNDSDWVRFGQRAGIDLRSLPYSFLVLSRKPGRSPAPPASSRVIGRPEHFKGYARLFACGEAGVETLELQKREAPELVRSLKRDTEFPLFQWTLDGRRIRSPRVADQA